MKSYRCNFWLIL